MNVKLYKLQILQITLIGLDNRKYLIRRIILLLDKVEIY